MEQRIIKFKAKRLSDNKWVEGDILHKGNKTYIYYPHINERGIWVENEQVDPSTVCQFTGLYDREGNEIFEHDLLTNDGTAAYKVGYIGCGYAASYKDENYFMFHLPSLSKSCLVYGNDLDRKEGEK